MPDALMQYDFCIVEARSMSGEFETRVYVRDTFVFGKLAARVDWEVVNPLSKDCYFVVSDLNFDDIADTISMFFGDTLISKKIGR